MTVPRTANPRTISPKVRSEVLAPGRCWYCGDPPTVVDHIVPVVQGGTRDRSNLVAACWSCNAEKLDETPEQWRERRARHGFPWPPPRANDKAEAIADALLAQTDTSHLSEHERREVRRALLSSNRAMWGPWLVCHDCRDTYPQGAEMSTDDLCAVCAVIKQDQAPVGG